ncbi:MAG TPA: ABC transporter permease, partial [Blastocatellia bacterium]|nr:ABC transporter permease [Blastocatellia bacterium]
GIWWLHIMGRLKPGATADQARESLGGQFQSMALELMPPPRKENEAAQIDANDFPRLDAVSGSRGMVESRGRYSSTIYLLFGVVGLVLLIACANVANLLLARAALRGSEITLRLAMGAGRWRLIRQLLTESVLLSAMGGAAGLIFALWGKEGLVLMGARGGGLLPSEIDYGINWRVLGFTIAISLLTGILFGIAPAWRATKLDLTTALKESNRSLSGMSRSRLSKTLVIAQVAMSLMLLVGAGLFLRTVRNLQQVDVGFNQENLLLFTLQPGAIGYKKDRLLGLYQQVFARLDALPGVRSATFAHIPLIANYVNDTTFLLPGETPQSGLEHNTNVETVRENYLETMEIPLLRGRGFSEQDDARATRVVIISEKLARKYFPDEDPLGKRIGFNAETLGKIEIIGIARDIKYNSQRDEIEPLIYLPWRQQVEKTGRMVFTLRTTGDPTSLATAVREVVRDVDSNLPVTEVKTQMAQASDTLRQERLFAKLLSFFGIVALLLASIGLYGVMAYSVAQRTSEIGIRMALGAQAGDVLRLVIWQGLKLVLVGVVAGAIASFVLKRFIESQLYGVRPADPLTFAIVGALLLSIALIACWVPARRAAKVDPMIALRNE